NFTERAPDGAAGRQAVRWARVRPSEGLDRERREVRYAIRLPANDVLMRQIEDLLTRSRGRPSHAPLVRYRSGRRPGRPDPGGKWRASGGRTAFPTPRCRGREGRPSAEASISTPAAPGPWGRRRSRSGLDRPARLEPRSTVEASAEWGRRIPLPNARP